MRRQRVLALLIAASGAQGAFQHSPRVPADTLPADLDVPPPLGLPDAILDPPDNPSTRERVALGRKLFFDPILSIDRSVACATCHRPDHGFADLEPRSTGVMGRKTERNAPTIFNRGFAAAHMWDARAESLERQALLPIENELEMALSLDEALARLRADPAYVRAFSAAFADGVTRDNLAKAIASFVRRLAFGDSPVDRFRTGEVTWLTKEERAGMWLFESRAACWKCHNGPNFSDEALHNTGIGVADGRAEPGREAITSDPGDRGKFKTPTLRALASPRPTCTTGAWRLSLTSWTSTRAAATPTRTWTSVCDPSISPRRTERRWSRSSELFRAAGRRRAAPGRARSSPGTAPHRSTVTRFPRTRIIP